MGGFGSGPAAPPGAYTLEILERLWKDVAEFPQGHPDAPLLPGPAAGLTGLSSPADGALPGLPGAGSGLHAVL